MNFLEGALRVPLMMTFELSARAVGFQGGDECELAAYMGVVVKEAFRAVDMPEKPRLLDLRLTWRVPGPWASKCIKESPGV
jgi:hypothetical protein